MGIGPGGRRIARPAGRGTIVFVRTLGIDLVTTNGSTGISEIVWSTGLSTIEVPRPRVANAYLLDRIRRVNETSSDGDVDDRAGVGWTAIDAPFGFPAAFTRGIHDWETRGVVAPSTTVTDDRFDGGSRIGT